MLFFVFLFFFNRQNPFTGAKYRGGGGAVLPWGLSFAGNRLDSKQRQMFKACAALDLPTESV